MIFNTGTSSRVDYNILVLQEPQAIVFVIFPTLDMVGT